MFFMYGKSFIKIYNIVGINMRKVIPMKKHSFRKDEEGQVLGLPMYLIVVMIVAVAVIAAVIFMIPHGTQTMNALVTDNAVISENPGNASKFTFNSSYDVVIKVTTNDERADPVADATVTIVGAGVAEFGTQTMNALVTDNAVISENPGNASKFTFNSSYDVVIKVTTNDERADPVADATVTIVGAGVAEFGTTNANGEVTISVTPTLGANVNEANIKLMVKAAGFEDFEDDTAVTVYRL